MSASPLHLTPLIRLERVTVRLRERWLLAGTDWEIYAGQHWTVIGPNGAGKSTLLRTLAGEMPVVDGRIGGSLAPMLSKAVALVSFERHRRLLDRQQGRDEARAFSSLPEPEQTVAGLLQLTPITDPADERQLATLLPAALLSRSLGQLSNGEMRRLLIARALLRKPAVLALDEPFTGLDGAGRRELTHILRQAMARGVTLVLATHRPEEIPAGIEYRLCVRDGHVVDAGQRSPVPWHTAALASLPVPPPAMPSPIATHAAANPHTTPLVELRGVTVRYGQNVILRNLSWTIRPGEHWAMLGPNGAGKSTLLRLIYADHPQAYSNEVYVMGQRRGSGESIWEVRRHIAWLAPELQLSYPPGWSAQKVVLSGFFGSRGLYRRPSVEQRAWARQWVERLGIAHLAERSLERLSAGEARLVLLARAVVRAPRLLLLDEPCDGLDVVNRPRVLEMVERIGRAGATQIVFVTHLPQELPACITHRLELRRAAGGGFDALIAAAQPPDCSKA